MKEFARHMGALLLLAALVFVARGARAVQISEICSSNASCYKDSNGLFPDWIELYNPADTAIDLKDYWLSNDDEQPLLFCLQGYTIAPKGYLVLSADEEGDLPFELSASGCEALFTLGDQTESVTVPALSGDETFSRLPDGTYGITPATPGQENAEGETYVKPVYVAPPVFSHAAGFYDGTFELTLSAPEGGRVFYTLDGAEPTQASAPYERPLYIDDASGHKNTNSMLTDISIATATPPKALLAKGTVVRAVVIDADGNASQSVTNTYFVGFQNKASLNGIAILSIVVPPKDMFDADDGIYMLGKRYKDWLQSEDYSPNAEAMMIPANYKQHGRAAEIPASVQLFGADQSAVLNQKLGLRIHGNFSRLAAKKPLKLYVRQAYGISKRFDSALWLDANKAKKLVLRNGGQDSAIYFQDEFAHTVLSERLPLYSRSLPCVLFLNGEYWGLYNIRESQDGDYISHYCHVDEDDVILIKDNELDEGSDKDFRMYRAFKKQVSELSCATVQGYETMKSLIDVENYTDYLAGVLYLNNSDWINHGGNFSMWRTRETGEGEYADGRWRWIYQDLDLTCSEVTDTVASLLSDVYFSALWTNEDYRTLFLTRVMDIANIDCAMARVNAILDEYVQQYRPYVADSYVRYSVNHTVADFDAEVRRIRGFFETRQAKLAQELIETLRLDRAVYALKVRVEGASDAPITLNGKEISLIRNAWSGAYFERCPITLCAGEVTGYVFAGWYEGETLLSLDASITLEVNQKRALTAKYAAKDALLLADGEHPPLERNGAVMLYTGARYDGLFAADEGIDAAIDAENALLLTARGAWKKETGFSLRFSTAGEENLTFSASVELGEGVGTRWTVEYGTDGARFTELCSLKWAEGRNDVRLELPAALNDVSSVYLRFCLDKKGTKKDAGTVGISGAAVYGDAAGVSLARVKEIVALGGDALGDAPDMAELSRLPQREIDKQAAALGERLASAMAQSALTTVGALGETSEALEGLTDYLCVEISPEAASLAPRVSLRLADARYTGDVYVYRRTGDALLDSQTVRAADGEITLQIAEGSLVLLDQEIGALRYRVSFDAPEGVAVEELLYNVVPDAYAWLNVRHLTRYQEDMRFERPAALDAAKSLWLYAYEDGALGEAIPIAVGADGGLETRALDEGTYLLLPLSLDEYAQEAEFIRLRTALMDEKQSEEKRPNKLPLLFGGGAALVAVALLALFLARRRRRR